MEVCYSLSNVPLNSKGLLKENQKMKKLPKRIKMRLKREAHAWDSPIAKEKPEEISGLLDKAQLFVARRPPRQPVSVRLDPFDLALLKRIARNKGLPFTQLMSMWLHEKVEQEKTQARA
jgi:predicted DNA binding CopG/RHH family protein